MNQASKSKRKFTFFENREVFAALQQMAKAETEKRGHIVSVPELIREISLKRANEYRVKQGKKPIQYDPSAGKFAPGGITSAAQAIVDANGRMVVHDRNGNRLTEWRKVQDIPSLLRLYPKCKIKYQLNRKVA